MSLVIPPGYGSAAFIMSGTQGTEPYVTTMGFDISGAGGDFVSAANNMHDSFGIYVMPELSNALTLERCTLSVGQDGPGGSVDSDHGVYVGGRSGDFPPTAMAAIVRKNTNELGRRGRGRMFLPGALSENEVSEDGSVAVSKQLSIQGAVEEMLLNLTLATLMDQDFPITPVLLHGPGAGGSIPTVLAGVSVAPKVGWIRGRIR